MADVTYEYVGDVNPNLICAICHNPFIDPVTTFSCKHTFCKSCIHESITHKSLCPIDRSQIDPSTLHDAGPVVINMLEELEVKCLGEECGYISQRGLIISHTNVCVKTVVKCMNKACAEEMTRENLSDHRIYECEKRKMRCETCKDLVPYHLDLTHRHKAPARPCGCLGNPQNGAHRWSCAEAEVPCDHAEMGCPAFIKRSDLRDHLTSCLFEQITPCLNTMKGEIEDLKKDRDQKSKQFDSLLRAQNRLNGQLADLSPRRDLARTVGTFADYRPSAAESDLEARFARAAEDIRLRRQARLNAQPIAEGRPARQPNNASTPPTRAQTNTRPPVTVRSVMDSFITPRQEEEMERADAEFQRRRDANRQQGRPPPTRHFTEYVERLSIARPTRAPAPARNNVRNAGNPIRPSRPITPPNPSLTHAPRLHDIRSRRPVRAHSPNIQPPSTASMQPSSDVSDTMSTQGFVIPSSLRADISEVAATVDSTSGGSSRQINYEIAHTPSGGLNISVSSSIVPGDSISNFRFLASTDNRVETSISHGAEGSSSVSDTRIDDVEDSPTSSGLVTESLTANHPVAPAASGSIRATAIEIDSDSEDDFEYVANVAMDLPRPEPEAVDHILEAVSHLLVRADRMERVQEAQALSGDLRLQEEIAELRSMVNVMRPHVMVGGQSLPPTPRIPSFHSAMSTPETVSESTNAGTDEPEHVSIIRETIAFSTQQDAPDETSSVSSLITANNPIRRNRWGNGTGRPMGIPPELGDGTPTRRVVVHRPVEHITGNQANVTPPRNSMMNRLISRTPRSSRRSTSQG